MTKDIELMKRMRFCGHLLYHRYPINMSQNRILLMLKREGALKQKDILERMNIKPGSLSEIIAKIEAGGYVMKRQCEDDRRSFELTLTEAGIERAKNFEEEHEELASSLFSHLASTDKEELFRILGILEEKWTAELGIKCPSHRQKEGETNA